MALENHLIDGIERLVIVCDQCWKPIEKRDVDKAIVGTPLLTGIAQTSRVAVQFFHGGYCIDKYSHVHSVRLIPMGMATFILSIIGSSGLHLSDLLRVYEDIAFEHMAVEHGGE